MKRAELIRSTICHTTGDPFIDADATQCFEDGGLLVRDGRVLACGDFRAIRATNQDADVLDWRGAIVVPGFVDAHVHFPQLRIIGRLGLSLLDWLDQAALPEEARMQDAAYAADTARRFVHGLLSHGTTTASVFGAHFASAVASLFTEADRAGLRLATGLVMSDRALRPELHQTPAAAYAESSALIRQYHGQRRLLYSVTPRFALSASEPMLEVCQTLMREHPDVRFQTHLNENPQEIAEVARLFPWAANYLDVYERYGLCSDRSIMAHDVHPTDLELEHLAAARATVAHCPASNAALGSGIFPLGRHLRSGVRCALGTDVGGGTGLGMLKEGLQAYLMQRVATDPCTLSPGQLLYLATLAGARGLGLDSDVGSFEPNKSADVVCLQPVPDSPLSQVFTRTDGPIESLAALFALGDQHCVREVRVAGDTVYRNARAESWDAAS